MKKNSLIQLREKINILLIFYIAISFNCLTAQWSQIGSVSSLGNWPSIFVLDANTIFIAGGEDGSVVWRSTDGGINFSRLPIDGLPSSSSGRFLSCIWATSVNTIYAGDGATTGNGLVKNSKVYQTTNGGTNWTTVLNTGTNVYGFINGIVFSRTNANLGIANSDPNSTTEKFKNWKTTNGGSNWTLYEADAPNSCGAQNSVFLIDDNFLGFGLNTANARVALTSNGGSNFNFSNLLGAGGDKGFVSSVSFSNDKINGLAGTSQTSTSIARTTNGGIDWFSQMIPSTITGHCNIKWVPGTSVVYIVISNSSETQCLKSYDNGNNWSFYSFPASTVNISHMDLFFNDTKTLENEIYLFAVSNAGNVYSLHEIPMPVKLNSFTFLKKDRDIILKWITEEEINNKGFEVYRKNLANERDWELTGFVKGTGNKNSPSYYEFSDNNLSKGKYLYKLKQIDFNGNFEYFNLMETIEINSPVKFALHPNFPNPFNSSTKISFTLPENAYVSLNIYDITGRKIAAPVSSYKPAGFYDIIYTNNNLPSGIYFCILEAGGKSSTIMINHLK